MLLLATESTVKGQAYQKALKAISPKIEVIEWPCQLLVALAEEGWCEGGLVEAILKKMIDPLNEKLRGQKPACFLLGCTHFPVLKSALQNVLGDSTIIIDPANTVANDVNVLLTERALLSEINLSSSLRFMATDGIERFSRVAQIFLGEQVPIESVELVSFPYRVYQHTDKILDARAYQGKA